MTIRIKANLFKNVMGTMFLLAAAFFVCSTLISMRSVFADPITPSISAVQTSGRTSPRSTARTSNRTVSRSTTASRATVNNTANTSRAVGTRQVSSRSITPTRNNTTTRNVASRSTVQNKSGRSNTNRAVRARTATNPSRVSTSGTVMAGTRASTSSSVSYSYLASKLYAGTYSDIIDSSTGLISADAYANCMDSYYTCMDEICTARSDTKGRCSCAGRVTNFLEAEEALETANEELIKLSGQLSLLIATKGKGDELASAFSLTEAEQVMNCVSWKETIDQYGATSKEAKNWCSLHNIYNSNGGEVSSCTQPSYCTSNNFGFSISDLSNVGGSSSDILAQLKAWADAKDLASQYSSDDVTELTSAYTNISNIVNSISTVSSNQEDVSLDSLTNKWGYKLFEYAHNNVCGRVLDSCFNGIYEACGTPPSVTDSDGNTHKKCMNGSSSSCPFNYNSYISVKTDKNSLTGTDNKLGDVVLNERGAGSAEASASCFGYTTYTTTSGTRGTTTSSNDPYATLRGPVADARRSIMQKYLLDANAACDVYGANLKQTAQNINYQKIAAEQALQQKRLEFKQEADQERLADATAAIDNFNECISEIWDCYEQYEDEDKWTSARIKTYCSQVSQVPHCYEQMICSPLQTQLTAVVDKPDSTSCTYSNDYTENTCRNVVTISEILYGTGAAEADIKAINSWNGIEKTVLKSNGVRENCLRRALGCASDDSYCLRTWKKGVTYSESEGNTSISLNDDESNTNNGTENCNSDLLYQLNATAGYIENNGCTITSCKSGYTLHNNRCYVTTKACDSLPANAANGTQTWGGTGYEACVVSACNTGYSLYNNRCYVTRKVCDSLPAHATNGTQTWNGTEYSDCVISSCEEGYTLSGGTCVEE